MDTEYGWTWVNVSFRERNTPYAHLPFSTRAIVLWLADYHAEQLEKACDECPVDPDEVEWLEACRWVGPALRRGRATLEDLEVCTGLRRWLPDGFEDAATALVLLAMPAGARSARTDATEGRLICDALQAVRPVDRDWAAEELARCGGVE